MPPKSRIVALDHLRGFIIVLVVLHHAVLAYRRIRRLRARPAGPNSAKVGLLRTTFGAVPKGLLTFACALLVSWSGAILLRRVPGIAHVI